MVDLDIRKLNPQAVFIIAFSGIVLSLFFMFLGTNGTIIGNDPAVHLQTANYFLETGRIPLSDIAWYPPLYHIVIDTFIAFTGVTNVSHLLVMVKAVTALLNWLLIFSVFLVARRFFGPKEGVLSAVLLMLCFPLFEINAWGGYTSILALGFMMLTFLYLAQPIKGAGNTLVAAIFAFSLVLSHQLATFLAVFILPPFVLVTLVKSRGHYPKALIAILLAGGTAFGIYYLRPILPYIGDLVYIIFFQLTLYQYQIPLVSAQAFMINFGFVFLFSILGLFIGFLKLRKSKNLRIYLLLSFAYLVPLFFSQSYLVGLLLPYQWFLYYMLPALALFAGVGFSFIIDNAVDFYRNNRSGLKKYSLKIITIVVIVLMASVLVLRFQTLFYKVDESATYYSTSDTSSLDAGTWIKENYPESSSKIVVTERPGHWFSIFTGMDVIAETSPNIEWNVQAESVLDLSYEIEHPYALYRAYQAKGNISDEQYVSMNMVWKRVTEFRENEAVLTVRFGENMQSFPLSDLERTIQIDGAEFGASISIKYSHSDFTLIKNIIMQNNSYPITVEWQLSANNDRINYANLLVSEVFDPDIKFTKAIVPNVLDNQNPWDNPSRTEDNWVVTNFSGKNFTDNNRIAVFDESNGICYGIEFQTLPKSGNLGALIDKRIDAARFQIEFLNLQEKNDDQISYRVLTFSNSSLPEKDPNMTQKMTEYFANKIDPSFQVKYRSFESIIKTENVGFIVYNTKRFDKQILNSNWLELVYSNDEFVVCKIKDNIQT